MSTSLSPEQVAQAKINASHHNYLQRVATGFDDFMNVATDGNLDETISARAERFAAKGNEFAQSPVEQLGTGRDSEEPRTVGQRW